MCRCLGKTLPQMRRRFRVAANLGVSGLGFRFRKYGILKQTPKERAPLGMGSTLNPAHDEGSEELPSTVSALA